MALPLTARFHRHFNPRFAETALWRCRNRHSGRVHVIHGPLAEILLDYPEDYRLRYLGHEKTVAENDTN